MGLGKYKSTKDICEIVSCLRDEAGITIYGGNSKDKTYHTFLSVLTLDYAVFRRRSLNKMMLPTAYHVNLPSELPASVESNTYVFLDNVIEKGEHLAYVPLLEFICDPIKMH
jgi:hypothetical protein